jgi:hypothetical protein
METFAAFLVSFVVAAAMVYFVDKKFGGTDDSYKG